jgi:hypothetical protein
VVANPQFGLEAIAAVPGGGLWAVGVTSSATSGSYTTLIEYHP